MGTVATWLGILVGQPTVMTTHTILDMLKDWCQVVVDILYGKDDGLDGVAIKSRRLDGCSYQVEAGGDGTDDCSGICRGLRCIGHGFTPSIEIGMDHPRVSRRPVSSEWSETLSDEKVVLWL